MNDLTIIIQGRVLPECLEFYCKEYTDYNIIISTWEDVTIDKSILTSNIKLIQSLKPIITGKSNIFLQVESTVNALNLIDTEYCIKMRGDETYSNIEYVYHKIKSNNNKLYTTPIYFRHGVDCNLHPSDHLIAGKTQKLKNMFYNFENRDDKWPPEKKICVNYFENCKINYESNIIQSMINNFDILDLNVMKPYSITTNSQKIKYHTNFIPEEHKSISEISMLLNENQIQKNIYNYYESINLSSKLAKK